MPLKSGLAVIQSHRKVVCSVGHNTNSCQFAIVSIALSHTIFELFDVERYRNIRDLKI